jgi:hypothetical protein
MMSNHTPPRAGFLRPGLATRAVRFGGVFLPSLKDQLHKCRGTAARVRPKSQRFFFFVEPRLVEVERMGVPAQRGRSI